MRVHLVGRAIRVWRLAGALGFGQVYFQKGIDNGLNRRIVGIVGSKEGGHRYGEGRAAMTRMCGWQGKRTNGLTNVGNGV